MDLCAGRSVWHLADDTDRAKRRNSLADENLNQVDETSGVWDAQACTAKGVSFSRRAAKWRSLFCHSPPVPAANRRLVCVCAPECLARLIASEKFTSEQSRIRSCNEENDPIGLLSTAVPPTTSKL